MDKPLSKRLLRHIGESNLKKARHRIARILEDEAKHPGKYKAIMAIVQKDNAELLQTAALSAT